LSISKKGDVACPTKPLRPCVKHWSALVSSSFTRMAEAQASACELVSSQKAHAGETPVGRLAEMGALAVLHKAGQRKTLSNVMSRSDRVCRYGLAVSLRATNLYCPSQLNFTIEKSSRSMTTSWPAARRIAATFLQVQCVQLKPAGASLITALGGTKVNGPLSQRK